MLEYILQLKFTNDALRSNPSETVRLSRHAAYTGIRRLGAKMGAKKYKCIKVHFCGKAHVEWKSGKTTYHGQEKYVDDVIILWRPHQDEPIGPGSFSFRFQFIIPPHVPSTFSHTNTGLFNDGKGNISYELEGVGVTGPFRFDDKTAAEIVIQRETSIRGQTQAPVRQVKRGQVGCLCSLPKYLAPVTVWLTKFLSQLILKTAALRQLEWKQG